MYQLQYLQEGEWVSTWTTNDLPAAKARCISYGTGWRIWDIENDCVVRF